MHLLGRQLRCDQNKNKKTAALTVHSLNIGHIHFLHLWSGTPEVILIESEAKSEFDHTLLSCVDVFHWVRCYTSNDLRWEQVWNCLNQLCSLSFICDQCDMLRWEKGRGEYSLLNRGKQSLMLAYQRIALMTGFKSI